jgi:hypothetical protein
MRRGVATILAARGDQLDAAPGQLLPQRVTVVAAPDDDAGGLLPRTTGVMPPSYADRLKRRLPEPDPAGRRSRSRSTPCRQRAGAFPSSPCPRKEWASQKECDRENQAGQEKESSGPRPERGWRSLSDPAERFQEKLEGCQEENAEADGEL